MENVGKNSWWSFLVDIDISMLWFMLQSDHEVKSSVDEVFRFVHANEPSDIYVPGKSVLFYNFFCRSYDEDELMLQSN